MKQYINFYHPSVIILDMPYSGSKMLRIWGATLIILTIIAATYAVLKYRESFKLASIQEQNQTIQAQLQNLKQALTRKQDTTALKEEIKKLEAERIAAQKMVLLLKEEGLSDEKGFAAKLEDLAGQHVGGTWYNSIHLNRGNNSFSLEGSALHPELVPRIVEYLGDSDTFKGISFDSVLIESPKESEKGYVNFVLQTSANASKGKKE